MATPCVGVHRREMKEDDVLSQLHDAVRDQTAADAAMTAVPTAPDGKALLDAILSSLDDDKAEEVVTIDLKGKSEMADFMVICSGRSGVTFLVSSAPGLIGAQRRRTMSCLNFTMRSVIRPRRTRR